MTMTKRGVCMGSVHVAECLYRCPACFDVEVVASAGPEGMVCPKCGTRMDLMSYSSGDQEAPSAEQAATNPA